MTRIEEFVLEKTAYPNRATKEAILISVGRVRRWRFLNNSVSGRLRRAIFSRPLQLRRINRVPSKIQEYQEQKLGATLLWTELAWLNLLSLCTNWCLCLQIGAFRVLCVV
ncbi:hypothetical protein CASFOL_038909 [Castilleja foliolosa]|uniref:Uncharacterized protein n=1 Tax=Castilleja foliolosa TaxID=1961234 RepID=A0ABD3BK71_9LAMI